MQKVYAVGSITFIPYNLQSHVESILGKSSCDIPYVFSTHTSPYSLPPSRQPRKALLTDAQTPITFL